jgi:hypothetical protein
LLRKAVRVSKYTASCLVYILETLLIGVLGNKGLLPSTRALERIKQKLWNKHTYVWLEFYVTDAMIYRIWTQAIYEVQHITSQFFPWLVLGVWKIVPGTKSCETNCFTSRIPGPSNTDEPTSLFRAMYIVSLTSVCHGVELDNRWLTKVSGFHLQKWWVSA